MPPLKNSRHEKFALGLVKGMNHQDAAIEAGYSPKWARSTASRLLATNANILNRVKELHELAKSDAIMTVKQRKERLSELAKESVKQPVTAKEVIMSVAELNKMEGEYAPGKVELTGKDGEPILDGLLERLRGYSKKDQG